MTLHWRHRNEVHQLTSTRKMPK